MTKQIGLDSTLINELPSLTEQTIILTFTRYTSLKKIDVVICKTLISWSENPL